MQARWAGAHTPVAVPQPCPSQIPDAQSPGPVHAEPAAAGDDGDPGANGSAIGDDGLDGVGAASGREPPGCGS